MPITYDTSESELRTMFKEYQELALKYLWSLEGEGASSFEVWTGVKGMLGGGRTISRSAIIIFLDRMVEDGLLAFTEKTGKGGYRRIYRVKYDEAGFKEHVALMVIGSLLRYFPEETRRAINKL